MARNCWENPQSPRFRQQQYSGPPGSPRGALGPTTLINIVSQLAETTIDSATLERNKELPVLKLNFSKLVREEVTCGKRRVMAVVDTGAALKVISSELPQESQFVLRPWNGPRVVMAMRASDTDGSSYHFSQSQNGNGNGRSGGIPNGWNLFDFRQ